MATSAEMVVVGCKLPNGLHLDVMGKDGQSRRRVGTLKGCAQSYDPAIERLPLTHGYRLTQVDAEGFAAWLEQHKDGDLIRSGVVFSQANPGRATAEAKEKADVPAVSAPVTPKDAPPPGTKGVTRIERADAPAD